MNKYNFNYTQQFITENTARLKESGFTQARIDKWFNALDRNPTRTNCEYMDMIFGGDIFNGNRSFCV